MDGPQGVQIVKVSMDLDCDEVYDVLTTHESTQETIEQWLEMIQVDEESIIGERSISPEAISQDKVGNESHLIEPCEKEILEKMKKESTAVCCALNQPGMNYLLIKRLLLGRFLQKSGAN